MNLHVSGGFQIADGQYKGDGDWTSRHSGDSFGFDADVIPLNNSTCGNVNGCSDIRADITGNQTLAAQGIDDITAKLLRDI